MSVRNTAWSEILTDLNSFASIAIAYFAFSIISAIFTWLEKPSLRIILPIQFIVDIVFIILLMHSDQSGQTGVGLLLIITVASAGLVSDHRFSLFYAAVATIGILLEQAYSVLNIDAFKSNFTGAAMLSMACFGIAWLTHSLARRAKQSEQLASQRGLDLLNLSQVNALITDEMKDGILVVNQAQVVKHHNAQAKTLLNIKDDLSGNILLKDISSEVSDLMWEWHESNQQNSTNHVSKHRKISVSSRDLGIHFLPVSPNKKEGAVVFVEDWSQAQTEAHKVKLAALGRLTANIAHEIRNPLSAISHANQLLQEDEEISVPNKRMLQIISDNVQRVDQIIKDVLELNRRDRTNQEAIDLEAFINEFYNQFCAVEHIHTDFFTLTLRTRHTTIAFDRRHLNQILWNLCKNGWRHSKQTENSLKLDVYLDDNNSTVYIEVTDNGDGIPEEVSAHLFEPFFTTEKTGTGLGLYISRELADANGAKLQYEDMNPGTRFSLLINKT